MEKKRANKRELLEVLVVTVFLAYGIHYFGYFLRTRYFGLIAPIKGTDPGLHSVLRYLGHLILLTAFAVYAFSIRDGREYLEVFLPKRENNRLSKLLLGMLIGMVMNGSAWSRLFCTGT